MQGEAQGYADALESLVEELRRGPGFSRVEDVDLEELPVREGSTAETSFEIR